MIASFLSTHAWTSAGVTVPEDLPKRIQTDSRRVEAGQWFVPIVGENHDGHSFIRASLEKGAAGFLYNAGHKLDADLKERGVAVPDTLKALQDLAGWWRRKHASCRVIGITGSSGKTSVKELCAAMLEGLGPTLKTEGSFNNELGVPLTLFRLDGSHRFAVVEMGARHKGDIAVLGGFVAHDIGVLLNVGSAHVGEFGGPEKILEAKMEIASPPRNVYLRDDSRIHDAMESLGKKELLSFGYHADADVRILASLCDETGHLHLDLSICGQKREMELPYFHQSHAVNVAACLAIGTALGLSMDACAQGLKRFHGVKGRFQVHRLAALTLIDDAYNANPQSMRAGLETVQKAFPESRKVLILGDMRELGEESDAAHHAIGSFCAQALSPALLVTVGTSSRELARGAREAGFANERMRHYPDVDALLKDLSELTAGGDLLYVKASNSLKLSKIVDALLPAKKDRT